MALAEKLRSIIGKANETTGELDTNVTSAVQRLVDGFGVSAPVTRGTIAVTTDQYQVTDYLYSSPGAYKTPLFPSGIQVVTASKYAYLHSQWFINFYTPTRQMLYTLAYDENRDVSKIGNISGNKSIDKFANTSFNISSKIKYLGNGVDLFYTVTEMAAPEAFVNMFFKQEV